MLELKEVTNAIIQNCSFGNWTFRKVQNGLIKNCNIVFHEGVSTSLNFVNSSAYMENITMEHEIITGDYNGIFVYNYSLLHVKRSLFVNNTVKWGIIKTVKSSRLIMSNCTVLENHATFYPGAIYANESTVHIKNTYFSGNMANNGGGAIMIENSVGNISESTFDNNVAAKVGGAISTANCSIYIENSKFRNNSVLNKVFGMGGGLFLYENSTMKISNVLISKCHGNVGAAIVTNFSTLIISNSSVTANTGSAIYLFNRGSSEINNCTFVNNWTPKDGGAILCEVCAVKMVNTRFSENMAVNNGGAVTIYGMSKFSASNCSLTKNTAYIGGAMSVIYGDVNISDSNFSHNTATDGGAVDLNYGYFVMANCRMNNNSSPGTGGVINALHGTLLMSYCVVFNNFANGNGGVLMSTGTELVIITSTFKKNTALGAGGVFYVIKGATLLRNSSFAKNFARVAGGVLTASDHAMINITQSFFFENQAKYDGCGMLIALKNTTTLISDTKIIQNSANLYGALCIHHNCTLELNGSLVEGNYAEIITGALFISNNSLLVAFNSLFKGNKAYRDSCLSIENSTAYLERCTFMENEMTYFGGTIATDLTTKLKISDTTFTQNEGYNLFYYAQPNYLINKIETHRCWFINGNISLNSNTKNFEEVAVKEKVVGQLPVLNQSFFKLQETPYSSSKMFHIMNMSNY